MKGMNGKGSIYTLAGNRRKKFAVRVTIGYDENGKPIREYLGYFETKIEAKDYLDKYNLEHPDTPKLITRLKYLFEEFIKYKKDSISKSTLESYKYSFNYLKEFHNSRLEDLTFMQLQNILNNCDKSYSTKKQIKNVISHLYKFALINQINVLDNSSLLNIGKNIKSNKRKAFKKEEIQLLFNNLGIIENIDLVIIMIYTGLRSTEFLNIEIENIDLEKRILIGGEKTEAGTDRFIAISNKILPLIKNRIGDREKGKLVLINNKEIKYSKLNEIFGNIMLSLGLNHLPHDTRHTFATLLSNADANTASIRKMMGHSSYEITEKIYTHKEITEFINAVDLLE